jgi:hypothetical protein
MLQELVGETKSQKLIDDCYKIYKENFIKKYPDYFEKNHTKLCSIVTTLENNEVKNIGMSVIDDLLTDNYAEWFGSMFACDSNNKNLTEEDGLVDILRFYTTTDNFKFNQVNSGLGGVGTRVKIGTGITPATRQDFKVETFLANLNSGNGGYNSGLGKIDIPATLTSTFTDTISEVGLYGVWFSATPIGRIGEYLLSHDIINPVVPVLNGQIINVDYQLLLS